MKLECRLSDAERQRTVLSPREANGSIFFFPWLQKWYFLSQLYILHSPTLQSNFSFLAAWRSRLVQSNEEIAMVQAHKSETIIAKMFQTRCCISVSEIAT